MNFLFSGGFSDGREDHGSLVSQILQVRIDRHVSELSSSILEILVGLEGFLWGVKGHIGPGSHVGVDRCKAVLDAPLWVLGLDELLDLVGEHGGVFSLVVLDALDVEYVCLVLFGVLVKFGPGVLGEGVVLVQ